MGLKYLGNIQKYYLERDHYLFKYKITTLSIYLITIYW